ncbi:MAG TPA: FMN-binding negative transcriptional regulator [Bacteroidia bacterium]|nr:FMN-binding negative transcriptional regulator [Bacteroidia bacterium]
MYIPPHYKNNDPQISIEVIKENAFGLLISSDSTYPFATHLPFLCREEDGKFKLFTHLAKANPHAGVLMDKEVLAVFTGPHAYISATWYKNQRNVPTWNYAAVHVKGIARVLSNEDQILGLLQETVAFFEDGNTEHHQQLPSEYKQALAREITFIEIEVKEVESKIKFNQNKPKEDLLSVIRHLTDSGNYTSKLVAEQMRRFNALH